MLTKYIFFTLIFFSLYADTHKEVFTRVYENAEWGVNENNEGWSGGGSSFEYAFHYREFVNNLLAEGTVKTVLDLGCGDWECSKYIDWNGVSYLGYDAVEKIIQKNKKHHAAQNIHFINANFLTGELPKADLMLCKHVCQHITNEDVMKIIKQIHKFKHCVFVNPVDPETKTSPNYDTEVSASGRVIDLLAPPFNLIDLLAPPFNLQGEVFYFSLPGGSLQQLLHIVNEK